MLFELWISCGVLCVFGCLLLVVAYAKLSAGLCTCKMDMTEKVVLITGASSGIGLETARELALRGARVIIGCRDLKRGREALQDIITSTGNSHVVLKKLDLSSFGSIRGFAEDLLASQDRLDVLINNAGVITYPERTDDGLERLLTTNFFGPFLLTNLLLPVLKKSAPSRIIMVAEGNMVIQTSRITFEVLNGASHLGMYRTYAMSKLALVMFVEVLADVLQGTGVTVNSLHPGYVRTGLTRDLSRFARFLLLVIRILFFKSPVRGAQTSVHLAVCKSLQDVSGKYFRDCRETDLSKVAKDKVTAKQVWALSEQVTRLDVV